MHVTRRHILIKSKFVEILSRWHEEGEVSTAVKITLKELNSCYKVNIYFMSYTLFQQQGIGKKIISMIRFSHGDA